MAVRFLENSYNVLGLNTSANEKEVSRRAKELINRLKIGDLPDYDFDIGVDKSFINEELVKDALQRLQNPKKKLQEYFFWFQILDDVDIAAYGLIKERSYSDAIRVWDNASENAPRKTFLYKKNLAVLYTVLLCQKNDENYLLESVSLWKSVVDSAKFWETFIKQYEKINEQETSEEVIRDFKKNVSICLSDIYGDIFEIYKDNKIISEFHKLFGVQGEAVGKRILSPALKEIEQAAVDLEQLKISEDGVLDTSEVNQIKKCVNTFQEQLNKLIDLGLYEDSQSKVIRDRAAEALRSIVLDLHNNLQETDKAEMLLKEALKFVGTSSMELQLKNELETLKEVKSNIQILKPIRELINGEGYEPALSQIEGAIKANESKEELVSYLNDMKKECLTGIALKKHSYAHSLFNNKREVESKSYFIEAGRILYNNIDLFNLNKEAIDEVIAEIKQKTCNIKRSQLSQLDDYRNYFVNLTKEKFANQYEGSVIMIIIDSFLYVGVADLLQRVRSRNNTVNILYTLGWITVWFYGIGLIFFIAGWIYNNQD